MGDVSTGIFILRPVTFDESIVLSTRHTHEACCDEITGIELWAGPRFTNGFSIAIQIRWKFRFTLISILMQWSLQNFVHGTTAVLSWHVQEFVAIWWPAMELWQGEVSIEFELRAKKPLVKRAPGLAVDQQHCFVRISFSIPSVNANLTPLYNEYGSLVFSFLYRMSDSL